MLGSVDIQLAARKQPYADQANFGISHWPFSVKLLWAPIVDSFFSRRIGRRKSWFVRDVKYLYYIQVSNFTITLEKFPFETSGNS